MEIHVKIVGVTGSGKSTLRQMISEMLNEAGVKWALVDRGGVIPGVEIPHNPGYSPGNLAGVHVLLEEVITTGGRPLS